MNSAFRPIAVAALGAALATPPAAGQEVAIKAGVAISRFATEGTVPFDGNFVGTSVGGHVRFRFGPIGLQPELHMVARGGSIEGSGNEERIRIEYLEVPLLLVLPFQVSSFEPFVFGGPFGAFESRCRSIVEEDGLKTNFGCDSSEGTVFPRNSLDYGATAGGGISHRLGGGSLLLEARYSWGLRDIYDGPALTTGDVAIRNRTILVLIGYTFSGPPASDMP